MKWFGNTFRMTEERKVKRPMKMRVEGRMIRRRPRIKWKDAMERTDQPKGKTMAEIKECLHVGKNRLNGRSEESPTLNSRRD